MKDTKQKSIITILLFLGLITASISFAVITTDDASVSSGQTNQSELLPYSGRAL